MAQQLESGSRIEGKRNPKQQTKLLGCLLATLNPNEGMREQNIQTILSGEKTFTSSQSKALFLRFYKAINSGELTPQSCQKFIDQRITTQNRNAQLEPEKKHQYSLQLEYLLLDVREKQRRESTIRLQAAVNTRTGGVHTVNQDAVTLFGKTGLAVFDGVGGNRNGEKASALGVKTVKELCPDSTAVSTDVATSRSRLESIGQKLTDDLEQEKAKGKLDQTATTTGVIADVCVHSNNDVEINHLTSGDSSLYAINKQRKLVRISHDDNWASDDARGVLFDPLHRQEYTKYGITYRQITPDEYELAQDFLDNAVPKGNLTQYCVDYINTYCAEKRAKGNSYTIDTRHLLYLLPLYWNNRNSVTSAFGGRMDELSVKTTKALPDWIGVLALSDGISDVLTIEDMENVLQSLPPNPTKKELDKALTALQTKRTSAQIRGGGRAKSYDDDASAAILFFRKEESRLKQYWGKIGRLLRS